MNWQEIREEFESSSITLKALAEKHDIKIGTLKSRKSREGWSRDSSKKVATQKKKDASLKPVIESTELTEKQHHFCLHYIRHFNATKAYQLAYDCDYKTAHVNSFRLMANEGVKTEIRRLKAEMQNELFVSAGDIAREYMRMAFANITDFVAFGTYEVQEYNMDGIPLLDDDGNPQKRTVSYVEFKDYSEVNGTMIQEVKQGKDGVSLKLYDKQKAMQELDKRLLSIEELKVQKLQAEIDKLHREGSPDTSTEDKLKDYFTALGGAFRDN